MVGEVGGEEEEEENAASRRTEGNTMGDGEDVLASWEEDNALRDGDEEDASGEDEDTAPWEEDASSDSEATPPSSETSDGVAKGAYCSPASNPNSCFTQGGQEHIHVHVTGEDVAGLSGEGLNVACNGLLGRDPAGL